MVPLMLPQNYHVRRNGCDQRNHALSDHFLDILPRNQSCKQFNQMHSHSFNAILLFIILAFIPDFFFSFISVIFFVLFSQNIYFGAIPQDFCEDWQVEVEELPGRLKDHVDALLWVMDEVSEDNSQAFEAVLLDIEEGSGVSLEDLEEQSHPRVEWLTQARLHEVHV